jgi:pyridinium-3,5-biscarboxylic acid mononucleotide synthase
VERRRLAALLAAVRAGDCSIDEALDRLRGMPYEDLGFAKLDHHRALRNGFPEAVLGEGKSPEQVIAIAERMAASGSNVLITRLAPEVGARLVEAVPGFAYEPTPRLAIRRAYAPEPAGGLVLVVSAGTADVPVAEEAALSAELMGNRTERLYDVGVAGLHRLLERRERLWEAAVLIVVAGMEGALPSVVGGLVERPVIAVPTSIGYGTSLHGLAALLGMLNTCAAGVVVVNIDNGFGAAAAATRINARVADPRAALESGRTRE